MPVMIASADAGKAAAGRKGTAATATQHSVNVPIDTRNNMKRVLH